MEGKKSSPGQAPRLYSEMTLGAVIGNEWGLLENRHERRSDGIYLRATDELDHAWLQVGTKQQIEEKRFRRYKHPTGDDLTPALPFPFTAVEFVAFCDSSQPFEWEALEAMYTDDPADGVEGVGPLNAGALAELGGYNPAARSLVEEWHRLRSSAECALTGSEEAPQPAEQEPGTPVPAELQEETKMPEKPKERRARRLSDFYRRGGELKRVGDDWQRTGTRGALSALVEAEQAAGRKMAKRQDVMRELKRAMDESNAEANAELKAEGSALK